MELKLQFSLVDVDSLALYFDAFIFIVWVKQALTIGLIF